MRTTARVTPAGEDRVVLAVIAGVLDQRHWDLRTPDQFTRHAARLLSAAVVHEDDLMPALHGKSLDLRDHRADRLGAAVERDDKAERGAGHRRD